MNRANVVVLNVAAWIVVGTAAAARANSVENLPATVQTAAAVGVRFSQAGTMNITLLVYMDGRGQIRSIQHAQRLPSAVNDLLWRSVQGWIKSSPVINGRHQPAQVLANVTLHTEPQSDGNSNVYFTLASMGSALRGYWILRGNRIQGFCSAQGDMGAGTGARGYRCSLQLAPNA